MDSKYKEKFLSVISNYHPLSGSSAKLVEENFGIKVSQKEDFIAKENYSDSMEYFLLEGLIHRFNIIADGESITTGFYLAGSVITPNFARTINGISIFSLQSLEDSILAAIPVSVLDALRSKYEDFRLFGKKVVEDELTKSVAQEIAFRTHSAKERLLLLRSNYPNLENIVPHSIIASYLGVTAVSFSRLRTELTKSK